MPTRARSRCSPPPLGRAPDRPSTTSWRLFIDHRDRAVIPTTTRHIWVVGETDGPLGPGFALERDYDLSGVTAQGDKLFSVLPDWSGRLWFVSQQGVVGTVDPASGAVRTLELSEQVTNSFAVDESGGVYIVSDAALYRLDATASGAPAVTWREQYPNSGVQKPGQVSGPARRLHPGLTSHRR
jgi:streptogramin lyase